MGLSWVVIGWMGATYHFKFQGCLYVLEKKITVNNTTGIHARPATKLTTTASKFQSEVQLEYAGRVVNVKSIMGVMSLGVPGGAEVIVRVTGVDENETLVEMLKLFEDNFGE